MTNTRDTCEQVSAESSFRGGIRRFLAQAGEKVSLDVLVAAGADALVAASSNGDS